MQIPAWIEFKKGKVEQIVEKISEETEVLRLTVDHPCKLAVLYTPLTGPVNIGDTVLLNTTASSLGLGTGGYHFVICNLNQAGVYFKSRGHGMKLKYTPFQMQRLLSEEQQSPYHNHYDHPVDFHNKMVYIGELHSMLMPLCAYFKYYCGPGIRIAYIMTDHGALPIGFSKNVAVLKDIGLLDVTITTGNAFGGEHECINIYTSLRTALNIENCHIAVVTMGPGILGTGTVYGFSGLELGLYANLIAGSGGSIVYIPRLGFNDIRQRHIGISHHSVTVLRDIVQYSLPLILPFMDRQKRNKVIEQLKENGLSSKHRIVFMEGREIEQALYHYDLHPTTMGRGLEEEPQFFYAIGATGRYGLKYFSSLLSGDYKRDRL